MRPRNDGGRGLGSRDKKEIIIGYMYDSVKRYKFEKAHGEVWFHGCIFEVDETSGKTVSVERLRFNKLD